MPATEPRAFSAKALTTTGHGLRLWLTCEVYVEARVSVGIAHGLAALRLFSKTSCVQATASNIWCFRVAPRAERLGALQGLLEVDVCRTSTKVTGGLRGCLEADVSIGTTSEPSYRSFGWWATRTLLPVRMRAAGLASKSRVKALVATRLPIATVKTRMQRLIAASMLRGVIEGCVC